VSGDDEPPPLPPVAAGGALLPAGQLAQGPEQAADVRPARLP
jgi:hypothetical protein